MRVTALLCPGNTFSWHFLAPLGSYILSGLSSATVPESGGEKIDRDAQLHLDTHGCLLSASSALKDLCINHHPGQEEASLTKMKSSINR